jgi:hypothetical protein
MLDDMQGADAEEVCAEEGAGSVTRADQMQAPVPPAEPCPAGPTLQEAPSAEGGGDRMDSGPAPYSAGGSAMS